jgi:hypothetical protein
VFCPLPGAIQKLRPESLGDVGETIPQQSQESLGRARAGFAQLLPDFIRAADHLAPVSKAVSVARVVVEQADNVVVAGCQEALEVEGRRYTAAGRADIRQAENNAVSTLDVVQLVLQD